VSSQPDFPKLAAVVPTLRILTKVYNWVQQEYFQELSSSSNRISSSSSGGTYSQMKKERKKAAKITLFLQM
jgi:hypothetical protein